jgi:formamidopyrimidine-DNA glycosylase
LPELPEAERARRQIERVLGREIAAVDDHDTYVCRPHAPGEIAAALVGHRFARAHRRGKFLWVDTEDGGPILGLHLGMAGRIDVDEPPAERDWDRFAITFTDGGRLALRDKRRLGRVVLEPDYAHVGPDAAEIGSAEFAERVGRGTQAIKARLLNQGVIAGVGNLLADEALWRAGIAPDRAAGTLDRDTLAHLHHHLQAATRDAIRAGGVHTGEFIPHRQRDGHCPRCGAALRRATIGGRTTYWCPVDQPGADPVAAPAQAPPRRASSSSRS